MITTILYYSVLSESDDFKQCQTATFLKLSYELNYISFIIIPKDILRQNDKSLIDFTQLFDIMH